MNGTPTGNDKVIEAIQTTFKQAPKYGWLQKMLLAAAFVLRHISNHHRASILYQLVQALGIRSNVDIRHAVKAWCEDPVAAKAQYGHISQWDTKQVTCMWRLFKDMSEFNEDISQWNVGNVEDMGTMFCNASSFNQDLSGWDVSNVKKMSYMFEGCKEFNQPLEGWDVANVECMDNMFDDESSLANHPSWYK